MSTKERTRSQRLSRLHRRANHLKKRIADKPGLTFDQAELGALLWAIRELSEAKPCPQCGHVADGKDNHAEEWTPSGK